MEIEDDRVGGAKGGAVPVAIFALSVSPHLSGNRVPETPDGFSQDTGLVKVSAIPGLCLVERPHSDSFLSSELQPLGVTHFVPPELNYQSHNALR